MVSELRRVVALLALFSAVGCAQRAPFGPTGVLFTYSTRPLTMNFDKTPVVNDGMGSGSVFQLQYYVRVLWGDDGIGGLAEEAGFDEVYYADITTLSIYTYFKMERVRVYGHRAGAPRSAPP